MKKIILTLCIALVAVAGAQAQSSSKSKKNKDAEKSEMNAQEVYKQQAESWATTFELNEEGKEKFIELYMEWQNNRGNIVDKNGYEQKAGEDINFKKITAEEAEKLIADDFARQKKQAETDEEYYRKFQQYISPGHAAQMVIQQRSSAAGMSSIFRNLGRGMGGGMGMGGMMMMF
ncbi:MAG: hypothetical protein J5720_04315 [Bacteroidaceae bacterium]|nr:hypothetical protein [Bacteroidaceae bacterium]